MKISQALASIIIALTTTLVTIAVTYLGNIRPELKDSTAKLNDAQSNLQIANSKLSENKEFSLLTQNVWKDVTHLNEPFYIKNYEYFILAYNASDNSLNYAAYPSLIKPHYMRFSIDDEVYMQIEPKFRGVITLGSVRHNKAPKADKDLFSKIYRKKRLLK